MNYRVQTVTPLFSFRNITFQSPVLSRPHPVTRLWTRETQHLPWSSFTRKTICIIKLSLNNFGFREQLGSRNLKATTCYSIRFTVYMHLIWTDAKCLFQLLIIMYNKLTCQRNLRQLFWVSIWTSLIVKTYRHCENECLIKLMKWRPKPRKYGFATESEILQTFV